MEKKHYYGIDYLRTFACIGIVMMHMLTNNKQYELGGFLAEAVIPSFTNFVFLFMVVSAFGMCVGYYDKVKAGNVCWTDFYKKRYMKILPFFAFLVCLDVLMSRSKEAVMEGFADVTLLFGLFPNNISIIGVGWFLGVIFAFYLIFPFFCCLIDNKRMAWFSLAVSVALSFVGASYFELRKNNIIYCLPFFIAGGLVFLYREEVRKIKWQIMLLVTAAAIVLYYVFKGNYLMCLILSTILLIQAILIPFKRSRIVSFISGISMEIYLSHMVIFRVIEKLHLNTVFGTGVVQYVITVVIVLCGVMVFAVCWKAVWKKVMRMVK